MSLFEAYQAISAGRLEEAARLLEGCRPEPMSAAAQTVDWWRLKAELHRAGRQFDLAEDACRQAIAVGKGLPASQALGEAHVTLGNLLGDQGRREESVWELTQGWNALCAASPDGLASTAYGLAWTLLTYGQHLEAAHILEDAQQLLSNREPLGAPLIFMGRALVARVRGDHHWEAALAALAAGLATDPDGRARTRHLQGMAAWRQGQLPAAGEHFQAALRHLDGADTPLGVMIRVSQALLRRDGKAADQLLPLALSMDQCRIHLHQGQWAFEAQNFALAARCLEAAPDVAEFVWLSERSLVAGLDRWRRGQDTLQPEPCGAAREISLRIRAPMGLSVNGVALHFSIGEEAAVLAYLIERGKADAAELGRQALGRPATQRRRLRLLVRRLCEFIGDQTSIMECRETARYRLSGNWRWSLDFTGSGPVLPTLDSPFASDIAQRTL